MNGVRSAWGVWLIVLAVISVTEFVIMLVLPQVFPAEHLRIVESVVDSVALTAVLSPVLWWVVVRPFRKEVELRERFLANLFTAIEDERRRIAHELHDGVGQSLTLVISGLRSLPESASAAEIQARGGKLKESAERALGEVKQLALALRPSLLDDLGLAPAIERVAAEIREHHPIELSVDLQTREGERLPEKTETACFRIFQEAMNNIVKHSGAKNATVLLAREPESVMLEIHDDGCGIEPRLLDEQSRVGGHLGIIGMRERAAQLGGELVVESRIGGGTTIRVRIPVKESAS